MWTALTLSTVLLAGQANAEKTTFANQPGQGTIGPESSAVDHHASGGWQTGQQQVGQPGPQMLPGPNPYVAMDPYGQMMMPNMAASYGVMPVGYGMPMEAGYGMPGQPMMDPNVMPVGYGHGGHGGCQSCGGGGCDSCMGGHGGGLQGGCNACGGAGCGGCCGLTGGGVYCGFSRGIGNAWDLSNYGGRCAPRYFDVGFDATFFTFEPGNNNTVLTSQGGANNPVLDTQDSSFDYKGGGRLTLQRSAFVGSYFEFSYLGFGNWASSRSVTGPGNLFSPFSGFGTDPVAPGYAEVDSANLQSFETSNNFDSFEINLRRFFTSPNCWLQSSYWAGFRYVRVADDSIYLSSGNTGGLIYEVDATNDMYGVQFGLDSTVRLTTRWSVTAFGEVGVYGTTATQKSTISFGNIEINERASQSRASMVAEGGAMSTFRLHPRVTLRAGYQVVYVDGIALSSDSFNFQTGGVSPLGTALANRPGVLNDNGNAIYHGPTVGMEYTW
ncbi:hypothetical protein C5Y93_00280 [Blastopirellula marina]|uniref:Uncharacterized protein n=1 Tax=Blastopirellula marina TaxID=124 RepID=A0A2S8GUQ4_9BACT|nr:hypothetical protein C5Y93_00280 [Blastopirellula marina]